MKRSITMSVICGGLVASLPMYAPARAESVPMPKPRPVQSGSAARPAAHEAKLASPSLCRLALTEDVAIAPSRPPIADNGGCGGEDLVTLQAVVLPGGGRVTVEPPAIVRCALAAALAGWVRDDLITAAAKEGIKIARIENYDSYACRGRNRVAGAKLSEHAKANAIDIRAFGLADGSRVLPTDPSLRRAFREATRASACRRFTTVLGPGSDGYHEGHVHFDLAARRGGFRLCQWDIRDAPAAEAAVPIARVTTGPPLPRPRPQPAR